MRKVQAEAVTDAVTLKLWVVEREGGDADGDALAGSEASQG